MASLFTTSATAWASARSLFRNFSRAGVAANRSRTSTRVPCAKDAGAKAPTSPNSTRRRDPCSPSRGRDRISSRATEAMEGRASPRNPRVAILVRSPSGIFEVAWRSTQRARSAASMPAPSSMTRISFCPPPSMVTSTRDAPASRAFSTSSLTAALGRSTTSPAAMRSARMGSSRRMVMGYAAAFSARPSGRPTMATSRLESPISLLATRLASSSVTASTSALRRSR